MLSERNFETHFVIMLRTFFKGAFTSPALTITVQILRYEKFYAIYLKSNIPNFLILVYSASHIPQFKMLIMPQF